LYLIFLEETGEVMTEVETGVEAETIDVVTEDETIEIETVEETGLVVKIFFYSIWNTYVI